MKEEFPNLTSLADEWVKQGYEVFHGFIRNCPEIKYAVEIVEYDIKTDYPGCSIIEFKAKANQRGIYIIVKCIKKESHEKSNT